jgi:hypothetical protein
MCLIIYCPPTASRPTKKEIEIAFQCNGDGAGIMYAINGSLHTVKPLWSPKDVAEELNYIPDEAPLAIHFRFATHGGIDDSMTHPFLLADGTVGMMHNGILPTDDDYQGSDTQFWVDTVFWGRGRAFLLSPQFRIHMESLIPGNKILLLDNRGAVSILNSDRGVFKPDGRWESTHLLSLPPPSPTYGFRQKYLPYYETDTAESDRWENAFNMRQEIERQER